MELSQKSDAVEIITINKPKYTAKKARVYFDQRGVGYMEWLGEYSFYCFDEYQRMLNTFGYA